MSSNITKNFDWESTNVPLVIFIPNYGRGKLIREHLDQFATYVPKTNYKIIIGNDGIEESFDDLASHNIFYFTIHRDNPDIPRNGCFIRNYVIRHCQCRNLFQKDPETVISTNAGNDWIAEASTNIQSLYRPGITRDITEKNDLKEIPGRSYRYHWGYVIPRQKLVDIGGYDEDYTLYGYEDTDLYYRLFYNNYDIMIDDTWIATHYPHPIETAVWSDVQKMKEIFESKDLYDVVRNKGKDWGRG